MAPVSHRAFTVEEIINACDTLVPHDKMLKRLAIFNTAIEKQYGLEKIGAMELAGITYRPLDFRDAYYHALRPLTADF
jgi:hypothetical protein